MTAGGVVAGIVIVTQIAGYGATMNFVDHMELLKKTKKDFKETGNLKFTLNSIKDLARKTDDEIREILKNNSSLSFKNGDEILTSEVNDILNKINPSDKSGVSRNYTALEAVNQARINKLYNNNSSFKNLISSRSKVFKDKIDLVLTRKQKRGGNIGRAEIDINGVQKEMNAFIKWQSPEDINLSKMEKNKFISENNIVFESKSKNQL